LVREAVVVHHDPCGGGGGERVFLNVVEALHEMGFRVGVVSVDALRDDCFIRFFGRGVLDKVSWSVSLGVKLGMLGLYKRILTMIPYYVYRRRGLVINTHGDLLPYLGGAGVIQYIHFPTLALQLRNEYPSKYVSGFWRMYYEPYRFFMDKVSRYAVDRSIVLTNSNYSREAIKRVYGVDAVVVYPPVDVRRFFCDEEKEDLVVSLGRLSKDKMHELALYVARSVREARFIVMGSTRTSDKGYVDKLRSMARDLPNVEIIENPSIDQVRDVLCRAKVLLHCMRGEHFGIAIVEAMAAGAVPVTWDLGGPRETVPEKYRFSSISEAPMKVREALKASQQERDELRRRAWRFSEERFREKIKRVVEIVLRHHEH
jgi:glycosyltransferase involved in cell wall biosynthesis